MRYPPEFVDRVQEANNLVDIISQYTQLKQSGGGYMGRCPFPDHAEKTASFSVSESKQVFHCFGCKKSGNIFGFLRDYNGLSFPEAIEFLAERASIPLPELKNDNNDQYQEQQNKKKQMQKINKLASDFFYETLRRVSNDHPVKNYVQKRKLKPETIEEFQIGYAPEEWESLTQYLNKKNISADLAEEAKLIKARKEQKGHFDLFRDRLMFPILSASQEVLAFGGRIIEQGEPKYLNSPETLVFNKSKVLYGLSSTAKYIRAEDCVVVVEGYMDLVSLYQSGLKNVAATMGTALTADHAKLIKRMTNNVVVLFDGDEAGQRAAERSLPLLLAAGLYPKGLILTEAKDPDEYVNQFGMDSLIKKIEKGPELFSMVLGLWMQDYRGEAAQKVKIIDLVKPSFDVIPDARLKSLYAQELAQKMNVTMNWVVDALGGRSSSSGYVRSNQAPIVAEEDKTPKTEAIKPVILLSGAPQAEILLMQLLLKSRANFSLIEKENYKQILSQISNLGVVKVLEKAEQVYRQDMNKFDRLTSLLIEYVDKPELLIFNSDLNSAESNQEKENKMIQDCCKRIQQTYLKAQAKRIGTSLMQKVDDDKLKEIEDLQRNRISLNKNEKN